jgi:opacity protein-like surface antigen
MSRAINYLSDRLIAGGAMMNTFNGRGKMAGIVLCAILACFCLCVKAKDLDMPDDPLEEPTPADHESLDTFSLNRTDYIENSKKTSTNYGFLLKAGSLGYGAEFAIGLNEQYNIRAGFSYFVYSSNFEEDDYGKMLEGKFGFRSISVLGDWHPFRNNFRLSTGLFFCNNKATVKAEPGFELALDDEDYFVDSFTGGIRFNNVNPYLGLGYGNLVKRGGPVVFSMDLGVMYHGTPRVFAEATASDPRYQQALQRDLDKELDDLRDDSRKFRFYPVLNLGLVYRF